MLNRLYTYFFNKSNVVRESFIKMEQESPWRTTIFSVVYLFGLEVASSFLKFLILIFKTPYESFQLFTNQYTLPVCEYSYYDHKKFQKKIRLFSLAGLSTVISATIIINLVLSLILPGQLPSYAKTVYPSNNLWDDWTLSSSIAGDPTVASSPATSISVSPANSAAVSGTGVDSVLKLSQTSYTVTDDGTLTTTGSATGGGFVNGTKSSSVVTGTGSAANVMLAVDGGTGADGAFSAIGDTFVGANGSAPDSTKWSITGNGPASTIQNNTLSVASATTGVGQSTGVQSSGKITLTGNFDILVSFSNFATSASPAFGSLMFEVIDTVTGNVARIERRRVTTTNAFLSETDYGGYSGNSVSSTVTAGSLRIARSGSTITTYYSANTTSPFTWSLQKTITANTNNLYIAMFARNDDTGSSVSGNFSNLSTNITGGTYNYTTFNIPAGVTVSIPTGGSQLIIKATGNVTIAGTLNANGGNGTATVAGAGGAGGYAGGTTGNGAGTGGGLLGNSGGGGGNGGAGGNGYGGGTGGVAYSTDVGGSGGGGSNCGGGSAIGGGGGGGYIKIISSGSITNSGTISANGGSSYSSGGCGGPGGSGGTILLGSAASITNSGTISAAGAAGAAGSTYSGPGGGGGRINLSAPSITGGTLTVTGGASGNISATYPGTAGGAGITSSSTTTYPSGTFLTSGTFESATIDLGAGGTLNKMTWNPTGQPTGATLQFQVAANNDNATWNYVGPDGNLGAYFSNAMGDNWSTMANSPASVAGTAMAYDNNGNFYAFRGNSTTTFYKYSVSSNTWSTMAPIPVGVRAVANVAMAYDNADNFYVLQSDSTTTFYKYSVSSNTWSTMASAPATMGGPLAYDNNGNFYALRGSNTTTFYKYSVSSNTWSTMASAPAIINGSNALAYDNNGNFYALRGSNTTTFYKYSVSSNTWSTMASAPATIAGAGGNALAYDGSGNFYAFRGVATADFWKYNISSNTWSTMTAAPGVTGASGYGGYNAGLAYDNNGNFYALQGNGTTTFWKYTISALASAGLSGRYTRYKAYLSTTDATVSPNLNDITVSYTQYPTASTITNIKFDTSYPSVKWTQLSWVTNAAMTSASKARYRVRVASSSANLATASFVGNDGTTTNASTYFDKFGTGQTNCSEAAGKFGDTAGSNATKKTVTCLISQSDATINATANEWLEIELNFVSDGGSTAQVDAIRATYSVNTNPEVCATLLASDATNQTCDPAVTTMPVAQSVSNLGHVTINGNNVVYIRDTDTASGTTAPGQVLVGLEYSDSAGNFSQATPPSSSTAYYNTGNFASNFTLAPVDASLTCTATGFTSAWKYLCKVNNNATGGNSVDPRKFAGYTIDWNAKADFANMSSDAFKVRLLVNDQEGINPVNISSPATSAAFSIDTVNPTGSVVADATEKATSNNSNAVVACNDGTTAPSAPHYPCSYSLSTDGTTFASWQSFTGASTTIRQTLAENASRESVLYFKLKDSYGNELPYDTGITGKKVITGQRPQNVTIQDVSNVKATPKSYKEFLSWETVNVPTNGFASYDVYRCDSSTVGDATCVNPLSYAKIASATPTGDRAVNYYTDSGLDPTLTYYYRIATKDLSGNISAWSSSLCGIANGTQDCAEGGGGGDVTPPTLSNIQVPAASITQNSAVITWTTSETANGGVFYGTGYGTEQSSLGYGTSHSISLSGLTSGTTYTIQIKSTDASGNQTICDGTSPVASVTNTNGTVKATNSATYCPGSTTYSFVTTSVDTTPPVISAVSSVVTSTWATVSWTTNENSDSCLGSRDAVTSSYITEQCKSEAVTSHSLTLSNLKSSTTYYIKVKSRDVAGNLAQNCYANSDNASVTASDCPGVGLSALSFTTSAPVPSSSGGGGGGGGGKTDIEPPRISDIKVSDIGAVSATVTWTTNENSSSLVQSGIDKDKLKDTSGQIDSVIDHKVILKNLTPGTKYFFKVVSIDAAGNIGSPDAESFTTKQEVSAAELKGSAEEKKSTQQVLEDLKKQIQVQGDSINDPLQALLESVSSLVPEPIIIGESPTVDETSVSAKISWRTDKNSSSFVGLSRDDQYDSKADEPYKSIVGNPEDSVKEHSVNVENLLPATKYHFQVRSKAILGEMSRSKDFTFTTKSELPEILKYLQKKTDNEKTATVYWQTSVPTDSVVKYTPYVKGVLTPKLSKIEGKPDMVADHEITITGLDPGTVYQMEISGRDPFGNQVSKVLPDFTTAIDKEPPVISQVRIESAMITGKTPKIQTIVSWKTDEPSTGQVFFAEGSVSATEKMKFTALDNSFTTIHTAVITEFIPASIYKIKIESRDQSDNLATSRDFTILTPAQSQSIIDVIVKTFENTFGWVKNIKF